MTVLESLFGQPLCQRLGYALVQFLWQGTLLGLLLFGALVLLRQHSAQTRYQVCCVTLFLMASCLPLTFALFPEPPMNPAADQAVLSESARPGVPVGSVEGKPLLTSPSAPGQLGKATAAVSVTASDVPPGQMSPTHQPRGSEKPGEQTSSGSGELETIWTSLLTSRLLSWTVAGWLLGVVLLSGRLLGGWVWVQRMRACYTHPVTDFRQSLLLDLCQRIGQARPIRLLESALIQVPAVVGWFRPVVLLPVSAATGLSPGQWEALLAHELAHICRHDYLLNLLQCTVETLLFYHPAIWWVSRQMRSEREHCCDDVAVSLCGDRLLYARALTRLEELRHETRMPACAGVAADGGSLMSRIRRVLGLPRVPDKVSLRWLAGLLTLALVSAGGAAAFLLHQSAPLEAAAPVIQPTRQKDLPGPTKKPGEKKHPPGATRLLQQIQEADRIVIAETNRQLNPPSLRFVETLKGGSAPGPVAAPGDKDWQKPLVQEPEKKWILFLRSVEEGDHWPHLAASGQDWYRPYSVQRIQEIRAALTQPKDWGQEDAGLRLGLLPLQQKFAAGEEIRVVVAIQNVSKGPIRLSELRYNIYDYWEDISFEIIGPAGQRGKLSKPGGPIKEADMPKEKTLGPGEIYTHVVRLNLWPVEPPNPPRTQQEKAPHPLADSGTYKVKARADLNRNGGDKRWHSHLVSPEVTIQIAEPAQGQVAPEVRQLVKSIADGKAFPRRPQPEGKVIQGVGRELAGNPRIQASYAKLNPQNRNVVWFEGIDELTQARAVRCLCTGLYHYHTDVQIRSTRALGQLKDLRAVPSLLTIAGLYTGFFMESESTHSILVPALAEALNNILGTKIRLRRGQDPEGMKKAIPVWRQAYQAKLTAAGGEDAPGAKTSAKTPGTGISNPLQIRLSREESMDGKDGGSVPLTVITYTNVSREPLELLANGSTTGHGFPGEEFEIVRGKDKWLFRFEAIDPAVQRIKIAPGTSWQRKLVNWVQTDLGAAPYREFNGQQIYGVLDPVPFQDAGLYKTTLRYRAAVQKPPPGVFAGTAQSNTLSLILRPSLQAQQGAALLKRNGHDFFLELAFWGKAGDDKLSLILTADELNLPRQPQRRVIKIDQNQVAKIVDHLAEAHFFEWSKDMEGKSVGYHAPSYVLSVSAGGSFRRHEEYLGWSKTLPLRLKALQAVLKGEAAQAPEDLLSRLEPPSRLDTVPGPN